MHSRGSSENGVDDPPRGLDAVRSGEQALLPVHRLGEQPGIGGLALAVDLMVVLVGELDAAAPQVLAGLVDLHVQRDLLARLEAEQQVVRVRRVLGVGEEALRRSLELDQHLGSGDRQVLAGADVERDTGPAPVLDAEPQGDERLHV